MSLDIKVAAFEPRRQTYSHIQRRKGHDRPASRYEEAVLDLQAKENFHYKPLWDPDHELYDTSRTAIDMEDWYDLLDPRQYYYGTWTMTRSEMQQNTERNFDYVDNKGLIHELDETWEELVLDTFVPMRHFEFGANMNNWAICDEGYGTTLTSPAAFCAVDRLGMAQLLSRIGLELDGGSGESLDEAKEHWMEDEHLQELRHAVEDTFVLDDWFETFIAQNFALDGVIHKTVFLHIDNHSKQHGGFGVSLLLGFMDEWFDDNQRWVDSVIQTAADESEANAEKLSGWATEWMERAEKAARPIARHALGDEDGDAAVDEVVGELRGRAEKLGLNM